MRSSSSLLAGVLSIAAIAACDVPMADQVDALAIDAGADGTVAAVARVITTAPETAVEAAPAIASEPASVEQLGALTGLSGRLGMVMDLGEGRAVGAITRVSARDDENVVLLRAHAPSEDEQALLGAPVALYQADGLVCRATVERLVEVASIVPAEGSRHGDRALWRIAEEKNGITVIAELSESGCDEPIFVEQGETPRAAAQPRHVEQGGAVETDALARLKALPRFAAVEASYRQDRDADPQVADWSELPETSVTVTEFTLGGARYLTAELEHEGYCGHFGGAVFAIWQRGADGALRLVLESETAPDGYDLAFDDDHDGVPELAAIAGEIEPVLEEEIFDGCGC